MHSSTSINNSAGFTDHVLIIAALGQVAMLCQQYHTSHLRLEQRSQAITALIGESPRFIHTIHLITLVVYSLSAVSHSIIKTLVSILSNTLLTVLSVLSVITSSLLYLSIIFTLSHTDSYISITNDSFRPGCVFIPS